MSEVTGYLYRERIAALEEELAAAKDIDRDWESITGKITEAFDTLGGSRGACQNYYEQFDWIVAQVTQAREQRDKLRAFAQALFDAPYDGGDIDGGDLQEIAVKHGLLAVETRTEPCTPKDARGDHPGCSCCQFGFPAECYRKTPLLTGGERMAEAQ